MMLRRTFLQLLGLAPFAPAVVEAALSPEPEVVEALTFDSPVPEGYARYSGYDLLNPTIEELGFKPAR